MQDTDSVFRFRQWVALLTPEAVPAASSPRLPEQISFPAYSHHQLVMQAQDADSFPVYAHANGITILVDGLVYHQEAMAAECDLTGTDWNAAEVILRLYERRGPAMLTSLRGMFSLMVMDAPRETMYWLRDPIGQFPFFYGALGSGWIISPYLKLLRQHPALQPIQMNRPAMLERILHIWDQPQDTLFAGLFRLLPGHRATVQPEQQPHIERYWYAHPPGQAMNWIEGDVQEQFVASFQTVIERFVRLGRVGVFLSGGLDSISVAAQAAALSQEAGIEAPVALSMDRRVHDNDETQTQSAIAAALGLPHYLISVDELADDGSLFASGRQMTGRFSYPVANPFLALFYRLVQQPTAQSCKVLMTGGGGDEWLGVSPQLAADHWRHGNLQGLWHMWQVCRQSSDQSWNSLLKSMVWTAGWRPILRDMTLRSWWAISPQTIRRRQIRRMEDGLRIWDFADASLRHTVHERMTRVVQPPPSFEGFYIGAINEVHTHLSVSIDMEQYFELGALCGCPLVLPFWDAELIEMLVRVPPERLNRGNRSKALVRTLVDQLFPSLQLGDQKKAIMRDTLSSIMWRELPALWQAIGSPERLFALDLITPAGATLLYEQSIKSGDLRLLMTVWEIINMESWLRNAET